MYAHTGFFQGEAKLIPLDPSLTSNPIHNNSSKRYTQTGLFLQRFYFIKKTNDAIHFSFALSLLKYALGGGGEHCTVGLPQGPTPVYCTLPQQLK